MCHDGTMDTTRYVTDLGREFADLAEAGGEEARALIERLTGPLESAIRMALLDALTAAADEISRELAPGSVEVRLRGREPQFVVSLPSSVPDGEVSPTAPETGADEATLLAEDGPAARINVRLPEQLKSRIEDLAATEGRSVNAWLVRAAAAAVQRADRDPRADPRAGSPKRAKQGLSGWVR